MEFLGDLEQRGDKLAEAEREYRCWSKEQQRTNMIASQEDDIEKLRIVSGYYVSNLDKKPDGQVNIT